MRAPKSNAILLAKNGAAVGIGMGQVNRVDAARLAVIRAGEERVRGAVAASDAFFPFPDGLEVLLDAGVRVVVQPGGSVRDDEVIAAAEAAGATIFTDAAVQQEAEVAMMQNRVAGAASSQSRVAAAAQSTKGSGS